MAKLHTIGKDFVFIRLSHKELTLVSQAVTNEIPRRRSRMQKLMGKFGHEGLSTRKYSQIKTLNDFFANLDREVRSK